MKKLLFTFILVAVILSACNPKVDPAEPIEVVVSRPVTLKIWWTQYCKYCVLQMDVLQEIQDGMDGTWMGEHVAIETINPWDTGEEIVSFLQKRGLSFDVATYPNPPIASGTPLTIIYIAGQTMPVATLVGLQNKETILTVLQRTLDTLVIRGRIPPEIGR